MNPAAIKNSARTVSQTPQDALWNVGTLTYTTAGLAVLFGWLLWGDFAWSMKERTVTSVIQLLLKKFNASDTTAALLLSSIPTGIAMILGPIISYRSDRHRGRWGRRIPYLLFTTPIAAVAIMGMAFGPTLAQSLNTALGMHSLGINQSNLIIISIWWMLFEFATITANSVFGALINDVVPRPVLGRFFGLFRTLSLIAGIIFNYWMLGKAETHFREIFIGVGLIYGIGFTTMCLKIKEGTYPPSKAIDTSEAGGFFPAVRAYFKDCFGKPYYLWVFACVILGGMASQPVNLYGVFFAKSIKMDMSTYGKYLALTYLISLGLSYLLGILADKFHPLRVGIVALTLYALATLWGGIFVHDARTFSIALVAHGVLAGSYMTGTAALGQMLLPQSKFAQLGSAIGLIGCGVGMVFPLMVGSLLDYSQHVYRYTYLVSSGVALIAVIVSLVVHAKFMALGGVKNYVAPE